MLILEKNKIYSEILRAMDIYGSACFEPEIHHTSLSNDRVMLHYGSRADNDMYYHDSNFKTSTCQTVKGCLVEFDQTELYYCVSSVFFNCRSAVHIYTSVLAYASQLCFNYLI